MTRLVVTLAIELVAIALLQRELGLDTVHLVILVVSTVALTLVVHAARSTGTVPTAPHPRWPRDRRDRRDGSRDDIASLAWTFFGRDDIVSAQALRHIRAIAATRLSAHGVDLLDPDHAAACRELLGTENHSFLDPTRPSTAPRPDVTELDRIVTALERLAPPQTTPRTPPTRTTP